MAKPRAGAAAVAVVAVSYVVGPFSQAQAQVLGTDLVFNSIGGCRIIDTRVSGQRFAAGETREFDIFGNLATQGGNADGCGIPGFTTEGVAQAVAVAIRYVAVNPAGPGFLKAGPVDQPLPESAVLNFQKLNPILNVGDEVPTPITQFVGQHQIQIFSNQAVDVVASVVGYYSPSARRTESNRTSPNLISGFGGNGVVNEGNDCPPICSAGVTIAGGGTSGAPNSATNSLFGVIAGGAGNVVSGYGGTIGGGVSNAASGFGATVVGGNANTASGYSATVAGGFGNLASGFSSLAAGVNARAVHDGAFVLTDANGLHSGRGVFSTAENEFTALFTGGVRLFSAEDSDGPSAGVVLAPGSGSWSSLSDLNAKANFSPVDTRALLEKLSSVPLNTWSYKSEDPKIRHIGPVAQDFKAAFGVGGDDRHIASVDAEGVALAAIQGLYAVLKEKDARIADLERQVKALSARSDAVTDRLGTDTAELAARLTTLEQSMASRDRGMPLAMAAPIGK